MLQIDLSVAEGRIGLASPVRDTLESFAAGTGIGYPNDSLYERLQESVQQYCQREMAWHFDSSSVRPIADGVLGFMIALELHLGQDGVVILPAPYYPTFHRVAAGMGKRIAVTTALGVDQHDGGIVEIEIMLRKHPRSVLVLCNPHNPTGRIYPREALASISEIVERYEGHVFVDEIYGPLTYTGHQFVPYATISPEAAGHSTIVMSMSKLYGSSGLKAAQIIIPSQGARRRFDQLGRNFNGGASVIGIECAIACYGNSVQSTLRRKALQALRDRAILDLTSRLPNVELVEPAAGLTLWLGFQNYFPLLVDVAAKVEAAVGVQLLSGVLCGGDAREVRMTFAESPEKIHDAIERIASVVR